jgi:hypothetical protein
MANYSNKLTDVFDITSDIDTKKEEINYTKPPTECNPNDPFSGW